MHVQVVVDLSYHFLCFTTITLSGSDGKHVVIEFPRHFEISDKETEDFRLMSLRTILMSI